MIRLEFALISSQKHPVKDTLGYNSPKLRDKNRGIIPKWDKIQLYVGEI